MALSGTLSGSAIREKFIRFFQNKQHQYLPSASLVPSNPTVLLTPAGMLPFVPVFLGVEPPTASRVVSVQKCARVSGKASDLEFVGRTSRHHTFFEMLGNFSFGDYFKEQVIPWAWEFITQELQLPPEKLWISVFETDMEARDIWRDQVKVPEERIIFRGAKDNFWGPPGPTGPCGPCSEIYYDWGEAQACGPECHPAKCDCDRYLEIWNLVFMELFKDAEGKTSPLERKNIDTGMGLERVAMVIQGKDNTFETDLLYPLVDRAAKMSGIPYKKSPETDIALKILADHIRCVTFAIADGITPSNEGRGYVIRMILRRAVRYGKKYLGFQEPCLYKLVTTVRDLYQETYPELKQTYNHIVEMVKLEEARFLETLERGSRLLEELIQQVKLQKGTSLAGEDVFKLYDTYGFPKELTADILQEEGLSFNEIEFEQAMEAQRVQARGNRKGEALVEDQLYSQLLDKIGVTEFLGYDTLSSMATVKALIVDGQSVDSVSGTNQVFEAILDHTPFYGESGGQVGDKGSFSREDGPHGVTVVVNDTVKVGGLFVHRCLFDNGQVLRVGEQVLAQVDPSMRQLSAIHHTATHLLQAALKKVLGNNVAQAGSYVSSEGARFDFAFPRAVAPQELQRVEYLVNKWILENVPRTIQLMDLQEAKQAGALAMGDEKYGEKVRVISYGEYSKELCGGTHIGQLGELGLVKITSEGAIASGVRRIEMVAGEKAYKLFKQLESELSQTAVLLKSPVKEVPDKVSRLLNELKEKDKALKQLEEKFALVEIDRLVAQIDPQKPILVHYLEGQSPDALKVIAERLGQQLKTFIVLLATQSKEKAHFVASVSDEYIKVGITAGDLVKNAATLCGGGGGGRPAFAQAGGKDPSQISTALTQALQEINVKLA